MDRAGPRFFFGFFVLLLFGKIGEEGRPFRLRGETSVRKGLIGGFRRWQDLSEKRWFGGKWVKKRRQGGGGADFPNGAWVFFCSAGFGWGWKWMEGVLGPFKIPFNNKYFLD